MEETDPLEADVGIVDVEIFPRVLAGSDCLGELVHLKNGKNGPGVNGWCCVVLALTLLLFLLRKLWILQKADFL